MRRCYGIKILTSLRRVLHRAHVAQTSRRRNDPREMEIPVEGRPFSIRRRDLTVRRCPTSPFGPEYSSDDSGDGASTPTAPQPETNHTLTEADII